MYARSTTVRGDPNSVDEGIAYIRDEVMPAVQRMDGCVGLSMLADRTSGRCIVTTAWADYDALRLSADGVKPMRQRAAEIMGGEVSNLVFVTTEKFRAGNPKVYAVVVAALDEAFKVIYAGEAIDFRNIKKQDLPAMLKSINDGVNKRFGSQIVESVLIQELNYISKAEARLGDKRQAER